MKSFAKCLVLLALVGLCGGGYYLYRQDQEYRQLHGRVTPVSVFTWKDEVEQRKSDLPVLLYFHSASHTNAEQQAIVDKFAWNNAGKVKVVSIDVDRPENLLFAARFAMIRQPGFVALYKDEVVRGYDGGISSLEALQRLVHEVQNKRP